MGRPNEVRGSAPELDATDLAILRALSEDGRMPNNALAAAVGIAPSTCLGRVRSLRERGVIRGFHADVDPAAVGLGIQALVAVQLRAHTRAQIDDFQRFAPALPGVLSVFHVAGRDDYLLHVAARSPGELRDFVVEQLTTHPAVAHAETSLVFEHIQGTGTGAQGW
jgi:DNA-binding Lrp family transcriptional regulator